MKDNPGKVGVGRLGDGAQPVLGLQNNMGFLGQPCWIPVLVTTRGERCQEPTDTGNAGP